MTNLTITESVTLAPYTTLRVGGPARYFCEVSAVEDLREAIWFAQDTQLSYVVLGGGSNVLVSDNGFDGLVVRTVSATEHISGDARVDTCNRTDGFTGIEWVEQENGSVELIGGAGEVWDELVRQSVERGLWGIENLSGIPGSLGASPVQNIGAYGVELADVFSWCEVVDTKTCSVRFFSKEDCGFGYRDSIFKRNQGRYIITRVAISLYSDGSPCLDYKDLAHYFSATSTKPDIQSVRRAVCKIRSNKFPDWTQTGTAGSFFINAIISNTQAEELRHRFPDMPMYDVDTNRVKVSTAWLLDHVCNLKGHRSGSVGLFEYQPLVLVNYGDATATEIDAFAREIEQQVYEAVGIELAREVVMLGM